MQLVQWRLERLHWKRRTIPLGYAWCRVIVWVYCLDMACNTQGGPVVQRVKFNIAQCLLDA